MKTTQLAIRGVIFNWMGRLCSLTITFFLTPYLVHNLGDAHYGLWSIVMALTGYYALADLGLRGAGTKYIAQYHATGDREAINKVIVTSLAVYSLLAVLVIVAAGIVAWIFPYIFRTAGLPDATMRAIVLLAGGTVIFRLISQVFNATLTALQRHDIANAGAVSQQLLQALGVVLAVHWGYGLVGMATATLIAAGVGQVTRSIVAARLLPGIKISPAYFDRATLKLVFSYGSLSVIAGAAGRLAQRSGAIIVGALLGPVFVTYFAIADALTQKARSTSRGITSVILPLASQLDSAGKQERLRELLVLGPRVLFALGLSLAAIFTALGRPLISLWLGSEYVAPTYPLLCILAYSSAAVTLGNSIRPILRGIARQRILIVANTAQALTAILLGVPLTYFYGVNGMAFAVLAACLLSNLVIIPLSTCQVLDYSRLRFFKQALVPSMIAAIPAAVMSAGVAALIPPKTMLLILAEIASIACVAALSVFVVSFGPQRRRDIISALFPSLPRLRRRPLRPNPDQ